MEGENARGESGNGRKGGRVKIFIISIIFDESVQLFDLRERERQRETRR